MDVLVDRFEWYHAMVNVFYKRLTKEEQIDAMLEVISIVKDKGDDV